MSAKISFTFSGKLWQHETPKGGWYFISLPIEMSREIREDFKNQEEGWGRLKACAEIHRVKWDTAIWYDRKKKTYLLPIKSEIRKKVKLDLGKLLDVIISL
jgi:Domain of unknown function (DUF1905)